LSHYDFSLDSKIDKDFRKDTTISLSFQQKTSSLQKLNRTLLPVK